MKNFTITEEMEYRLFANRVLVAENNEGKDQEAVYLTLIGKFGVKIADENSFNKLHPDMLKVFERIYCRPLGEPFYRGFPESVKRLSDDEMVIDRLLHYMQTYGTGDHENRHFSLFEEEVEKVPFREEFTLITYKIVDQEGAVKELYHIADTLLMRRQIQDHDVNFVMEMIEQDYVPTQISSKQIMCLLIRKIRESKGDAAVMEFIDQFRAFELNDVLRLIGWTNADNDDRRRPKLNKLQLSNKDRKFYTALIEHVAARTSDSNLQQTLEKRKNWKGLLHHIHFNATGATAKTFAKMVFDDNQKSVYAEVERLFKEGKIVESAKVLVGSKGSTALMRQINRYLCAATTTAEQSEIVKLSLGKNVNPTAAMQAALSYLTPTVNGYGHTFSYNYYGRTFIIMDTRIKRPTIEKHNGILLATEIRNALKFQNTGKKIYIDPKAENYAMPIWVDEIDGVGVMPTGSRISIPDTKVVRAFVYWEKECDLDLSGIAISRSKGMREFSWRSSHNTANEGIVFSGDVTDGVNGGAEYFDIDFDLVQRNYADYDYLIFSVNNYSSRYKGFNEFTARAGFMTRDKISSGEIFEPKTVKSAFDLTTKSRQVTMFALDLKNREMVWINKAPDEGTCAGDSRIDTYLKYVNVTKLFNLKWFFENIAGSIVTDPTAADIIVSDDVTLEVECKTFINLNNGNAALEYLKAA